MKVLTSLKTTIRPSAPVISAFAGFSTSKGGAPGSNENLLLLMGHRSHGPAVVRAQSRPGEGV